jgi:hypothetical protein
MAQAEAVLKEWVSYGGPCPIFNLGSAASLGDLWLPVWNDQGEYPAENGLGIATGRRSLKTTWSRCSVMPA